MSNTIGDNEVFKLLGTVIKGDLILSPLINNYVVDLSSGICYHIDSETKEVRRAANDEIPAELRHITRQNIELR